ncbi:MAG: nuclear transport factor 2 family protein [Sneathiellales bacterium]|nr:nuclear transport factor 2 family protein [Sneathiellales bacterium]
MTRTEFMRQTSGHPYADIINRYYQGCNTADMSLMMSVFHERVVHYFVDHSAVKGATGLANYWAKVGPKTQARWVLDHIIVQEPEAVIEWSMSWIPPQTGRPEILRGSEWYLFEEDKILEIRSYHNNFYLQNPANRELHDYDYEGRGYHK